MSSLTTVYNRLCRFVLGCPFSTHHCTMYQTLDWPSPSIRRERHWLNLIFKCIHLDYPPYLKQLLIPFSSTYNLRHTVQYFYSVPSFSKAMSKKAFKFKAPSEWNNLPLHIRSLPSLYQFKNSLRSHYKVVCSCR